MKLFWKSHLLELKRPFVIKHGSRTHQPTLIVCIEKDGIRGYGEASAIHYYGVSVEAWQETLLKLKDRIEHISWHTPHEFFKQLSPLLHHDPFLLCALDVAAHDWYARQQQVPLYQSLGLQKPEGILCNFTISYGTEHQMKAEMDEYPWPIYKIKLTQPSDILLIPNLLEHTKSKIRIDANTAWTKSDILKHQSILEHPQLEFIEQPLETSLWGDMEELHQQTNITFIADESAQNINDLEKCVGRFSGINVKVMKCGGITPAIEIIQKAKSLNLKIMLGCMTESIVGISAISHLLSLVDYADVDGSVMIKNNPGFGVLIENGKITFPAVLGSSYLPNKEGEMLVDRL